MTTDTTTLPAATYARLPDDTWGMRVPGFAAEGTRVLMRKKDGSEHEATVGEVVRRFSGRNPAVLARITHSGERRVSVPKLDPLPRCTLCREQFTAARPRSTRDDSPGRCSVCSPAWPTCRGCEKVMYGCRPEPGGVACPPCARAEAFDEAMSLGERAVDERMARIQAAFDDAAADPTPQAARFFTEFASDIRHLGFSVGCWPQDVLYRNRVFFRSVAITDTAGEFQGHKYASSAGDVLTVYNT